MIEAAGVLTAPSDGGGSSALIDDWHEPLALLHAELAALAGDPERVRHACDRLLRATIEPAALRATSELADDAPYQQLGVMLARSRNRAGAAALFEQLVAAVVAQLAQLPADAASQHETPLHEASQHETPLYGASQHETLLHDASPLEAPRIEALLDAVLQVRERPLRNRAVDVLAHAVAAGLQPRPFLLERLAAAVSDMPQPPALLVDALRTLSSTRDVTELLEPRHAAPVRRLAARVLDAAGEPAVPELWPRVLGSAAAERLGYFLAFTRATHQDLLALLDERGGVPLLDSLDATERLLGAEQLARVITEIGWSRVSQGLETTQFVAVRIGGGLPVLARPAEAALLLECDRTERGREATLVVAHGVLESVRAEPAAAAHADVIRRFRDYNLLHAELLGDILEVAPVTADKARRIMERLERLAAEFALLFAQYDEEAERAPAVAAGLADRLRPLLQAGPDDVLGAEPTRLVQAFEDPRSIGDVSTVHGLKRYLHQRGLRNAFRLFHAADAANRTVDLVLVDPRGPATVVRRIRYIDFEPRVGAVGLPPIVRLVVESYVRTLAHGTTSFPDTSLLVFGHEVQLYLTFRSHPAFVRLDLSPPRRGGMVDLEYFAVSQHELAQHPALEVPAIRAVLERLGFFVDLNGVRLHARFDKERAFDHAEVQERAAALLRLAPLLMDLDWTVGGLAYSPDARTQVLQAWADRFLQDGVLPVHRLLTADRSRILRQVQGEREVAWDGMRPYCDRYSDTAGREWWSALRHVLERHGLARIAHWEHAEDAAPAQLALERVLLLPLRAALDRREVVERNGVLRPTPAVSFRRVHEATRFATLLADGGSPLLDAAQLAAVLQAAEAEFRFHTTGTINGYAVQRTELMLPDVPLSIAVLRDAHGTVQLALAVAGPAPYRTRTRTGAWRWCGELDRSALLELLLRDNYLSPSSHLPAVGPVQEADVRARFAQPAPRAPTPPLPGDRVIAAVPAAPGRAAGVVRLGAGRAAHHLTDAILAAPVVRPEDAPQLNAAAGAITTGGGILSHAGLLALESGKPSLLVAGRWLHLDAAAPALRLRRTEHAARHTSVGGYDVACWELIRECDEEVREGDLLAIDADEGTLRLLGQERTALALHHSLGEFELTAARLATSRDDAELLQLRGRLLRVLHGLRRLLREMTAPGLAHHVVRQLFAAQADTAAASARPLLAAQADRTPAPLRSLSARADTVSDPITAARRELLQIALANTHVGPAAAAAAAAALAESGARLGALHEQARSSISTLRRPTEILFLRLALVRLAAGVRGIARIYGVGVDVAGLAETAHALDEPVRTRLKELRELLLAQLPAWRADASRQWQLRHVLPQFTCIDSALGEEDSAAALRAELHTRDTAVCDALNGHLVVTAADGGHELAPLIGYKAAGLGELERALGPAAVPDWFAVTDLAFRMVLATPAAEPGTPPAADGRRTLADAIQAVLDRSGIEPRQQADAIAALWDGAVVPPVIVAAVEDAYRALADEPATATGDDEGGAPFVAIRSSSFEEDRTSATWAGQFDTFLYVRGTDDVLRHLKRAWAGLWNERALLRRGAGAPAPGGGLIVQHMVQARVAGVLHTASVAAAELREMLLNAGLGLGSGIVSGEVGVDEVRIVKAPDPDAPVVDVHYIIGDKSERFVFDDQRGTGTRRTATLFHQRFRAALEYGEVLELARIGARLEAAFGQPLDIEFALAGERIHVLQARPIPLFGRALDDTLRSYPLQVEHADQ
jgi:hypothetical protein